MALKHLLNEEDIIDFYPVDHLHPSWGGQEGSCDPTPSLQEQSWEQYVNELLGSQSLGSDLTQHSDEDIVDIDSLRYTLERIEQWTAKHLTQCDTNGDAPRESIQPSDEVITSSELNRYTREPIEQRNARHALQRDTNGDAPLEEAYICYGTVFRTSVKLCGSMIELDCRLNLDNTDAMDGHMKLKLIQHQTHFFVAFPDDTVLGEVNAQLEKALMSIAEQQYRVDCEVFASVGAIRETIDRATKEKDAVVRMQVDIYGPRAVAQKVGKEFSQHKIYLQRPKIVRHGASYENPHILILPGFQPSPAAVVHQAEEKMPDKSAAEIFKKTITNVYSSLTRGQDLRGLEGDDRLKTPLLLYQKEALEFMTQRESGPIPESYRLWKPTEKDGVSCYRHAVTNTISRREQIETGGGILADEMGMGKSLSVLALILRTLAAAHQWVVKLDLATSGPMSENRRSRQRSRATLIVASSDLMINEWFQELEKHFDESTFRSLATIKYHGKHRECFSMKMCDADIVITTYHTLASDFSAGKSLLSDIEWYRLVLDEAHIIRRQSTTLYRTVSELAARSRWCLTGTPIQNRLEDIGSLFAFLKIEPFHNLSTFRKYIVIPFDEGNQRRQLAVEQFTRLLDSLCLRRTKDLLHLPDQQSRTRNIVLSPEERTHYDQAYKMMFRAISHDGEVFDHKSKLTIFQVQLQLRIICNHGTWQQPFSWIRRKLHLLAEREALEASTGRSGEVTCSVCRQPMPLFSAGSMFRRFTEHCKHVLCLECLKQSIPSGQEALPTNCPLCSSLWVVPIEVSQPKHESQEDMYFRAEGRSSKIETLIQDLLVDFSTTKSIIFTCWTRTLDLLQFYLTKANFSSDNFKRIDGECPTTKRERILHEFATSPHLRVLIMTTGTGAVGLNLATANRVFIVEPQWNPSVENQAIARALRLGQQQSVLVTRYVVEQTVEEDMRALQDVKRDRASLVKSG
ncbi:Nn.00g069890.m01.CDS01 [Neocucurbitaria sp. VM-36]